MKEHRLSNNHPMLFMIRRNDQGAMVSDQLRGPSIGMFISVYHTLIVFKVF